MTRKIAIVIYPGFTALDAIGPHHVLAHTPGTEVVLVAPQAGPIDDVGHLTVIADAALSDVPAPDIVLVAGGMAAFERADPDDPIVQWLRAVHPATTWTASVCTGALLLGAAGLLHGKKATTHWFAHDRLAGYGATPSHERVVFDGATATAAGVSAGIDLALALAARLTDDDTARLLQLDMEYAPEPPFDAGTPTSAGVTLTEHLSALYRAVLPHGTI